MITVVDNIGKVVSVFNGSGNVFSIPCYDLEDGVYYV